LFKPGYVTDAIGLGALAIVLISQHVAAKAAIARR
jgi:hypothetical protein